MHRQQCLPAKKATGDRQVKTEKIQKVGECAKRLILLVTVKKKGIIIIKGWLLYLCLNPKELNKQICSEHYHLPTRHETCQWHEVFKNIGWLCWILAVHV